jgi:hypothetical protein
MHENKFKLNGEKTEVMVICHPRQRHKLRDITIQVGEAEIVPALSARNLGVLYDQHMNMDQQVTAICKATNFHLRNIGRIRKYLTKEATETVIHSLVTSRLDNNNALLVGLPDTHINRLQKLQRTAARIVLCVRKYDSVDVMTSLHWLPIRERITFKILLLVFKALHGKGPQYLLDMLHLYEPSRNLRSQHHGLLEVPRSNLVSAGDRAFSVIGPKLWNSLPASVKMCESVDRFKATLKTFLFKEAAKRQ